MMDNLTTLDIIAVTIGIALLFCCCSSGNDRRGGCRVRKISNTPRPNWIPENLQHDSDGKKGDKAR